LAPVVNLNQARKRKARDEREIAAAQNRALHGRTKSEKARDRLAAEKVASLIEGHRLEPPPRGDDG
jgi:hypothetical protein